MTFHDIQHAHASWLLAGGADLKSVMDRMGDTQIQAPQKHFHAHPDTDTPMPSPASPTKHRRSRGIRATILLKSDQQAGRRRRGTRGRLPGFDAGSYRQRNVVERAVNKLRCTRAVATRYDKRDYIYRGTIDVATIRIWLRDPVRTHMRDTA